MKHNLKAFLVALLCGLLASCAFITVNVYFPEKDVKQAYKSLDEKLLGKGGEAQPAAPAPQTPPPVEQDKAPEVKPQSRLLPFDLVPRAHAADNQVEALVNELSGMPDVQKAYGEMRTRLTRLDALRDSGAVGESNQGLVSIRDKSRLTPEDEALVKAENDNRKTVIAGMARAILRTGGQAEARASIDKLLPKAAATFAEIRRDAARSGWWVQAANGPSARWIRK